MSVNNKPPIYSQVNQVNVLRSTRARIKKINYLFKFKMVPGTKKKQKRAFITNLIDLYSFRVFHDLLFRLY